VVVRGKEPGAQTLVAGGAREPADVPAPPETPAYSLEEGAPLLPPRPAGWWLWGLPLLVMAVTLAVSAALALAAQSIYSHNERRLLTLRVREGAALVAATLPSVQTPLASAAELADATGGDVSKFRRYVSAYAGPQGPFDSISLWRLPTPGERPLTVVGAPLKLLSTPGGVARAAQLFAQVRRSGRLSLIGLLSGPDPRLGYAFATPGGGGSFVAYGEGVIAGPRPIRIARSGAFSDVDYALYLGALPARSALLLTDSRTTPLRGRTATDRIGFGDGTLTLVMAPRTPLAGSLPRDLPWIVGIGGFVLALIGALTTLRLIERRRHAERLAGSLHAVAAENRRLFSEQRTIAQTLQRALLPEALPSLEGLEISAHLQPGERGLEIGGDWYDAIELGERRLLLVVGDVSGRGLRAAGTMAALRFAVRAYAAEGLEPEEILTRLSSLLDLRSGGQMTTVLCVLVDTDAHALRVVSAGHLPPALIEGDHARFLPCEVGLPVGVERSPSYRSSAAQVAPGAVLLAFTDGLVERRGESIDRGLARLLAAAVPLRTEPLPELLVGLVERLRSPAPPDDTVLVALRWMS
jgi:serine phosphatase RsbU (regulator of sigma subunit)